MREIARVPLYVSRTLSICAVLAGLAAGFIEIMGASFGCFDTCPSRSDYFARLEPTAMQLMTPCVVLGVLATAGYLAYCLATRQGRRAIISLLVVVVGGMVGIVTVHILAQHAQATLPVWGGDAPDLLRETPFEAWEREWALVLTLVAGIWSGTLAYLQWRR